MHALNRLILFYNTSSSRDAYDSVADVLLANLNQLPNRTIYDWAELCNVSTSTISRFCQKMGYRNFNEFKLELENVLQNYHILNEYSPTNQIDQYASQELAYLTILKNNLDDVCRHIDFKEIEHFADVLARHQIIRIYPHGVSLNEANLQANLIMSGRHAKSLLAGPDQMQDIETLPKDALVLITCPNVHERTMFHDLLKALKDRGITTMVLTNSKHSAYLKYADYSYAFDGCMTQLDDYQFNIIFSLISITFRRKYLETNR